jgi:hypothetical protein
MKTARFLFTILAFGSLALGVSHAGPAHDNKDQGKRAPATGVHPPGLNKAATAANGGLMLNKIGNNHEQPARPPVGGRTTAPLPGVVRGRSATAAAIGGAAASSAKHPAAALNGSDIKRKP